MVAVKQINGGGITGAMPIEQERSPLLIGHERRSKRERLQTHGGTVTRTVRPKRLCQVHAPEGALGRGRYQQRNRTTTTEKVTRHKLSVRPDSLCL